MTTAAKRKKVLTFAFVSNNVGDDLFIDTLCKRYPDVNFYINSKAQRSATLTALPNLKPCRRMYAFDKLMGLELKLRGRGVNLAVFSGLAKLLVRRFRVAVFIAGSVFVQPSSGWKGLVRRNMIRATATRRYYVVSANFGPYTDEGFWDGMGQCFEKAEDVCFRDSYSQWLFRKMENVRWAPDAVFTTQPRAYANKHQVFISTLDCKRVGRPPRLRAMAETYADKVTAMAMVCMDKGWHVCLASFCEKQNDGIVAEAIAARCREHGYDNLSVHHYDGVLDGLLDEIAASDYVIATRFHAMVLGWLYGKPVMPLVYNEKMTHVLEDVPFWRGYNITDLAETDPAQAVDELMRQPIPDCTELCERAQEQFLALDKALGRKAWQPAGRKGTVFEQMIQKKIEKNELSPLAMNHLSRLLGKEAQPEGEPLPDDADQTLITVITPTHNRLDMLTRAVDSVLMQTHKAVQMIVVDDASTDATPAAFPERYRDEPRVEYIRNETSLGPGGARQAGYLRARGETIIYLDDDDFYLEPRFFEKALAAHRANPTCALVCANAIVYNVTDGLARYKELNFRGFIEKEKYFIGFIKTYAKPYSSFPTMFRKSALEKAGFHNMTMMNDMSIYLRALCYGDAYALPDIIGVYIQHKSNISKALPHSFLMENLMEKKHIWEIARTQFDRPLDEWYRTQIMSSVRYYFCGSRVTLAQKREICRWCLQNCPHTEFALLKALVRSMLGRFDPRRLQARRSLARQNKRTNT